MAFIAVALASCAPVKEPGPAKITDLRRVVTIVDDRGGNVAEFEAVAEWFYTTRTDIRIDGPCASACLVFTYPKYMLNVCVTERAWFGFHSPFMVLDGKLLTGDDAVVTAQQAKQKMFTNIPFKMQEHAPMDKWPSVYTGAKFMDMFWVRGTDVMKECE